jgi:hypothetical protein
MIFPFGSQLQKVEQLDKYPKKKKICSIADEVRPKI